MLGSTVPTWLNLAISYALPCLVVLLLRSSTCRQKPGLGWTNVYTDISNLFFWGFTAQVKLQYLVQGSLRGCSKPRFNSPVHCCTCAPCCSHLPYQSK